MSEYDTPTTSYREIGKEWWDAAKRITNGWQFWLVLLLGHTVVTIAEAVSWESTYPLWFDLLIFGICIFYFALGWMER